MRQTRRVKSKVSRHFSIRSTFTVYRRTHEKITSVRLENFKFRKFERFERRARIIGRKQKNRPNHSSSQSWYQFDFQTFIFLIIISLPYCASSSIATLQLGRWCKLYILLRIMNIHFWLLFARVARWKTEEWTLVNIFQFLVSLLFCREKLYVVICKKIK